MIHPVLIGITSTIIQFSISSNIQIIFESQITNYSQQAWSAALFNHRRRQFQKKMTWQIRTTQHLCFEVLSRPRNSKECIDNSEGWWWHWEDWRWCWESGDGVEKAAVKTTGDDIEKTGDRAEKAAAEKAAPEKDVTEKAAAEKAAAENDGEFKFEGVKIIINVTPS